MVKTNTDKSGPALFISKKNKTYSIVMNGKKQGQLTETELQDYFDKNNVSISNNGILYRTDKKGLIPTLLSSWFDKRKEFRKLAKKFWFKLLLLRKIIRY